MRGIWALNLKRFITGTTIGSKYGLDVNIANTSTIPTSSISPTYREFRHMDASVTSINDRSGAFKEIGDTNFAASNVANTITEIRIANNTGYPLIVSKGADATAAATSSNFLGVVNEGQTSEAKFGCALVAGDKLWVRSMGSSSVSAGIVVVTLFG
jgi:hypothetical protein